MSTKKSQIKSPRAAPKIIAKREVIVVKEKIEPTPWKKIQTAEGRKRAMQKSLGKKKG